MPDGRYTASCLLFALKNIISRGCRGCSTIDGIFREEGRGGGGGGGGYRVLAKMENPKGWGVLYEIPCVVGVWIFSVTTQYQENISLNHKIHL